MFTSVVLHCKVIKPYHTMTGLKKTWNTSCHESQDICCWLEKFENQFKGCDCTLDSVCFALKLAYHLIGLAETLCLSLELGDKTLQFRFLNFLR